MTSRSRPRLADPADPRFRGLPRCDGTVRRFLVASRSAEAALYAERYLEDGGYGFHPVGSARAAHGPNGDQWTFTWRIGDGPLPLWAVRLADLTAAGTAASGRNEAVR
jgi:hypothetical protein